MSDHSGEGDYYNANDDDCISSIADQYGFFWKTLWLHPQNKDLRTLRKNPNVLLKGDQVFVPPKELKQEERPTEGRHTFVRKGIPSLLRLRFTKSGEARANLPYILIIDGSSTRGSTDGDGRIEVPIPPRAQQGTLILGEGKEAQHHTLDLGMMNPVDEPDGAIKRLESLGYDCGLDKETGLSQALKSFQADNGIPLSGDLDTATQNKLSQLYGC